MSRLGNFCAQGRGVRRDKAARAPTWSSLVALLMGGRIVLYCTVLYQTPGAGEGGR